MRNIYFKGDSVALQQEDSLQQNFIDEKNSPQEQCLLQTDHFITENQLNNNPLEESSSQKSFSGSENNEIFDSDDSILDRNYSPSEEEIDAE